MKAEDRKAAVAAYKDRKVEAGIYAVRCTTSGEVWAGAAPDLSTIRNRIWFMLRQHVHTDPALQQAWDAYGVDAFVFDVVERLEEENIAYVRRRLLKERLEHWVGSLRATRL